MAERQSLHRKLFLARKAAEAIEKRGEAEDFKFARSEDVLEEANRVLEKQGILIVPSVESTRELIGKSGNGIISVVSMTFEVIDSKTGESFTKSWTGTGHDKPGDKASYKAITGGTKYFLAGLLGIPFGTDPEEGSRVGDSTEQLPTAEAQRVREEQDAAAEEPDITPRHLRPLPETDLPEPDYEGLARDEEEAPDVSA